MPDPSFRNPRTGALSAIAKYMRGLIDKPEFDRQSLGEHFFPREGTHATRAWFSEFDQKKGDLGFHFGTEEQARQRMIQTRDDSNRHLAERYIDARLRANNPLYYPGDVGAWELSPESARALLASRPYGASTREGFAKIISDKERDWLQKIRDRRILTDHQDALEEMRQMMEKQGFDSLIYRNTVENLHGSIPGMSPRALEAYNRLQQQRLAIDTKRAEDYRKANPRSVDDMPPRDPQTQELIPFSDRAKQRDYERWEKGRRPFTEEERARDFALYNRMNKIEGIGQNDPNSIIVLRPNQIRSVNAEFDPAKLSSGNLMAGTAAGAIGIGAATAGEEEREPYADGGPANPRLGALAKIAARIGMSHKDVTKRIPQLTNAAQKLRDGTLTREEYDALVNAYKPVEAYASAPMPTSREDALAALSEPKRAQYGATADIPAGERTELRLDIPAYTSSGAWVNSVHRPQTKQPTAYSSTSSANNVYMIVPEGKALDVAAGGAKSPFAVMRGEWNPMSDEEALARMKQALEEPSRWKQIGMDPERHGYFYDRTTTQPITRAEEVVQVGPLVVGRDVTYGSKSDFKYAEGGPVNPRLGALAKLAARIANPIRAYHGSPHKFDKFDISKIGSGEGSQAYGHGLYFAENPAVATDYRNQLSNHDLLTLKTSKGIIQGDKIDPIDLEVAKYLDIGARDAGQFKHNTAHYAKIAAQKAGLPDVVKRIDDYGRDVSVGWEKNPGSLYTVDLHVPREHLLDWDMPLSKQADPVREMLSFDRYAQDKFYDSAGEYYRALMSRVAQDAPVNMNASKAEDWAWPAAAKQLFDRGIPGIQYLDQKSRMSPSSPAGLFALDSDVLMWKRVLDRNPNDKDASLMLKLSQQKLDEAKAAEFAPTRNIVMFDDAPIEIVERKAEGGMVDPDGINKEPMASGGALAMNEGGSVYERLAARVRAAFEEQEAPGFADGGDIDWNSYAQTYQQMLNPAMSGSTGLNYTEPVGAQQQQPVDPIGSGLSSFTPGSAGDGVSTGLGGPQGRSTPGTGYNMPGRIGSAVGSVLGSGIVGGALGNVIGTMQANRDLMSMGVTNQIDPVTMAAYGAVPFGGLLNIPGPQEAFRDIVVSQLTPDQYTDLIGRISSPQPEPTATGGIHGVDINIEPGQGPPGSPGADPVADGGGAAP